MQIDGTNPYQPVLLEESDEQAGCEVAFRVTAAQLRHAEAQYLLHWLPARLLVGSLAMIIGSFTAIVVALPWGVAVFFTTLVVCLSLSASVYLTLVHRSKRQIRERLREHGLVDNAQCRILVDENSMVLLETPHGTHTWPRDDCRTYRTRQGLLVSPSDSFYVFVPKRNDGGRSAFRNLRRRMAG